MVVARVTEAVATRVNARIEAMLVEVTGIISKKVSEMVSAAVCENLGGEIAKANEKLLHDAAAEKSTDAVIKRLNDLLPKKLETVEEFEDFNTVLDCARNRKSVVSNFVVQYC